MSRILVLSNSDPQQHPVSQALEELGHCVETASLSEFSGPVTETADVIVLTSDGADASELTTRIASIRTSWDAPIILVTNTSSEDVPLIKYPNLETIRIPADLCGERLEDTIAWAHEIHALREQLAHNQKLLQSAPVGVFEITDNSLTYVNEYLLERTGYSMEKLRSLPLEQLVIAEDQPRFSEALRTLNQRSPGAPPSMYRFLDAHQQVFVGEVKSRIVPHADEHKIAGTIRDITQETRTMQLHRVVLELTEVILAEQDIDRLLQMVLDTIVAYSGFRRALLSLYDLSIPVPFEGRVYKTMTAGLTAEEREAILAQPPIPSQQRKDIYSDRFKLGAAYYIPHDETPWLEEHGITGTVTVEGWHPDDYLFIPLRGAGGIIGSISVDDPIDQSAPTVESIEPVAFLANFAALAVERVFKLARTQRHAAQLHGLAALGTELAKATSERALCDIAAKRVQQNLESDASGIYLLDGVRLVHEAVAARNGFPQTEIPDEGTRVTAAGPGINRWVLLHGEAAVIADVEQDPRYNGTRETIRSYIAVPISGRKGSIGVIYAACQRAAAFGDQDLEVLTAVANHLATALASLRRRTALDRIFAFGQQLAAASTISQTITSTLDFLVEQFDFQLSAILLLNEDGSLHTEGVGGAYGRRVVGESNRTTAHSGIVEWVKRNSQSVLVPDVSKDDRYDEAFHGTSSELAVPLLFNGQLLGVISIESPQVGFFDNEDRRLIEVVANQLATALSNISSQEDLRQQAIRDPLTGLFNRHYFNSIIASEISRSDRYKRPLSLMMIDIDGFGVVNNKVGHLQGDEVLRNVARMIEQNVRDSDRAIRYGGDEFLILMPETNKEGDSQLVSTRLREEIQSVLEGTSAENLDLTLGLSIGTYCRQPGDSTPLEEILEEVDLRMYADKRARKEDHADDYRH